MKRLSRFELNKLPEASGVYLFKNSSDETIYIGKANNLRKRVSSYFSKDAAVQLPAILIGKIKDIDYIVTDSEAEALVLESRLIKKFQPRYNVKMKDDKKYPYLEITKGDFPRMGITRRPKKESARVYGPYTDAKSLRRVLRILREVFCIRTCNYDLRNKRPARPCLYYNIKRCSGPCAGYISRENYNNLVKQAMLFLEGKNILLRKEIENEMEKASTAREYEKAIEFRDRLKAIDKVLEAQAVSRFFPLPLIGSVPLSSDAALINMKHLWELLNLAHPPFRVEGIDVSHISGKEATGVVTVFENGMPKSEEYRRFRIKFSPTRDDCRMISEVVGRRYRRVVDGEIPCPDLILVDGGKGQVAGARRKLKELGLDDIEVIGIAKKFEKIYRPGNKTPLTIPATAPVLNFLKLVRDEAHRFAQRYHHLLRKKRIFS